MGENARIESFMDEIEYICKLYGFSIWTEEGFHESFSLINYEDRFMKHLREANFKELH